MTAPDSTVRVTILGSGDAFSSDGRLQSGYLLESSQATALMDCGPTVLASLKQRRLDTSAIDFVLISHLHGDHFGGLPFLFLEYLYENRRERRLVVAGPPGLEERTRTVFAALFREATMNELSFPLEFRVLEPGKPETIGPLGVLPFRVPHQTTCVSLGLRITVDGRHILYSGDSAWSEDFVAQSQGTDLFLCECVFMETDVPYHMNYRELARHVPRLGCKRLVLTHLGSELLAARDSVTVECVDDGTVLIV
jgi:ribonuclease BN (tRNA processing enzyme)